jgi:hypothetical protein
MDQGAADALGFAPALTETLASDVACLALLRSYLQKRHELESLFARETAAILNGRSLPAGSPFAFVLAEIRLLNQHHLHVALELEEKILPPLCDCLAALTREQKLLAQQIQAAAECMRSLERQVYVAKKQAERSELESLQHSPTKRDRPRRSLKSNEQALADRQGEQTRFLRKLREEDIPQMLHRATTLDLEFRHAVKRGMRDLGGYEGASHQCLSTELIELHSKIELYEPAIETQIVSARLMKPPARILAIVKSEWVGGHPNDLPLIPREIIEVTKRDPSGWWEGEWNGQRGLFPMTLVDVITEDDGGLKIDEVFEIVHRHDAARPDELSVCFGDFVYVYTITEDWCTGCHVVRPEQRGRFPVECLRGHRG